MENDTQKGISGLWWIVGVLVIVLAGWYGVSALKGSPYQSVTTDPNAIEIADGVFVATQKTDVPVSKIEQEMPSLAFVPDISNPSPFQKDTLKTIKEIQGSLGKDPNIFGGWLELGSQYTQVKEYDEAEKVLRFAGVMRPTSALPVSNLAFLYGYYLKDTEKAIEQYWRAIELEPTTAYHYVRFFEFYRDTGDLEQAREMIRKGLVVNPEDEVLQSYSEI